MFQVHAETAEILTSEGIYCDFHDTISVKGKGMMKVHHIAEHNPLLTRVSSIDSSNALNVDASPEWTVTALEHFLSRQCAEVYNSISHNWAQHAIHRWNVPSPLPKENAERSNRLYNLKF